MFFNDLCNMVATSTMSEMIDDCIERCALDRFELTDDAPCPQHGGGETLRSPVRRRSVKRRRILRRFSGNSAVIHSPLPSPRPCPHHLPRKQLSRGRPHSVVCSLPRRAARNALQKAPLSNECPTSIRRTTRGHGGREEKEKRVTVGANAYDTHHPLERGRAHKSDAGVCVGQSRVPTMAHCER
ncbi:uncharacterized protein LOC116845618 [Odontomachus brunneus]|uniref:uncharacterized protein LOC116845618 n=1 Tax=Odontomachus brunneus TaxID=486640 RepID=UPI0013F2868C|nr:uncharacterized protein LOC116845618 [Odontomachus brunneus]